MAKAWRPDRGTRREPRDQPGRLMSARLDSYRHDGLTFEVTDSGPQAGRVVIMLHGFPEDRHQWSELSGPLVEHGYRVLAPDQRGYSPGATPKGRRAYRMEALTGDVLALADAAGAETFDVVGHDWGALVAWSLAAGHPQRLRSLCALSVPHPAAIRQLVWRSSQALRSSYVALFQLPWLPERLMGAGGGRVMASGLERGGLDAPTARRFAAKTTDSRGLTGPLNWYRAMPLDGRNLPGPVTVPTLFVWGDRDRFVSRAWAEACGGWVTGRYRFAVLQGKSHWLPTTAAQEVSTLLSEHLAGTQPASISDV